MVGLKCLQNGCWCCVDACQKFNPSNKTIILYWIPRILTCSQHWCSLITRIGYPISSLYLLYGLFSKCFDSLENIARLVSYTDLFTSYFKPIVCFKIFNTNFRYKMWKNTLGRHLVTKNCWRGDSFVPTRRPSFKFCAVHLCQSSKSPTQAKNSNNRDTNGPETRSVQINDITISCWRVPVNRINWKFW